MKRRSVETLGEWLNIATRRLSFQSQQRVREEIFAHAELCRQDAIKNGATNDEACRIAIESLGDPKVANREYRKVYLTEAEQFLLLGRFLEEPKASYQWLFWLLILGCSAHAFYFSRDVYSLLLVGISAYSLMQGVAENFLKPTQTVGLHLYRALKWSIFLSLLWLAFNSEVASPIWSARGIIALAILSFAICREWTNAKTRKKLPANEWPRSLYL